MKIVIIRIKMKHKIYYFQLLKTVKHLVNKLIQNHKNYSNSNSFNQGNFFSFKPSIILGLDTKWMVGLTRLQVYDSIFNRTTENVRFEFNRLSNLMMMGVQMKV